MIDAFTSSSIDIILSTSAFPSVDKSSYIAEISSFPKGEKSDNYLNNSYPFIPYIISTLVPAVKVNVINKVAIKTYLIIF